MSVLVKPPQSRRGKGWSQVRRESGSSWGVEGEVYVKEQSDYMTRMAWRGFLATPTLANEYRALRFCQSLGLPVPEIVAFEQYGTRAQLVLKSVADATPLDDFIKEADSETSRAVIEEAGNLVGRLHARYWVHGALGSEHLLVTPQGHVVIIDWEKASCRPFRRGRDLQRLMRQARCLTGDALEIFMGAYKNTR